MTTTKSPVSTCGVNMVFPLPRRRFATVTATRPSGRSFASTTYHFRSIPLDFAENVFMNILPKRVRNLGLSRSTVNGILFPNCPLDRQSCKRACSLDHRFMRILPVTATLCFVFAATVAQSQDVSALIRKADELDAQDRTDAAIETLKQAEKISPNDPTLLIKLSQDYSDQIDNAKGGAQKLAAAKLCLEYA